MPLFDWRRRGSRLIKSKSRNMTTTFAFEPAKNNAYHQRCRDALLSTMIALLTIGIVFSGQHPASSFQYKSGSNAYTMIHSKYRKKDRYCRKIPSWIGAVSLDTEGTSTSTTKASLKDVLLPGTELQKYGTPVGAVVLPTSSVRSFNTACKTAFPESNPYRNRGVEDYCCSDDDDSIIEYKAIHVPMEVAAALIYGEVPSLVDFIYHHGGHFLPGARMKNRKNTDSTTISFDNNQLPASNKFTFVELFAGVGGFRIGLESVGGKCVLANEKDPTACAFYRRHFGNSTNTNSKEETKSHHLIEGDVLDLVSTDFPPFDLLTGGFPCQPFSVRGQKGGLSEQGHRGQLYLELVRILMEQQPKLFLFENVLGLVTMEGGRIIHSSEKEPVYVPGAAMNTILEAFESCGYKVQWQVVNAKHFCPQHRERVYFFGSLRELNCPDLMWENIYEATKEIEEQKKLRDYLEKDHASSEEVAACELTEQQWEMIQRKHREHGNNDPLIEKSISIDRAWAPTLISSYKTPGSRSSKFITEEADGTLRTGTPLRPRFLTPTEFRRIMGFPDSFDVSAPATFTTKGKEIKGHGRIDGNIYKVLGNAVVPSVIEAIGKEIVRLMEDLE